MSALLLLAGTLAGFAQEPGPAQESATTEPSDGEHPIGLVKLTSMETPEVIWPWNNEAIVRATDRFFDHLYSLEYDRCEAICDSLEREHPTDPWIAILRIRIFRDLIREVDVTKEEREEEFEHLNELFDPVHAKAMALLEQDPRDPRAHLTLGWEGMIKGQVQVMLRDYFGANSSTKEARDHLETVLEQHPDSPDTKALLGGYLYSVDTLPKFLKIFKWIPFLGIPSGDRDLGIQMVIDAGQSPTPSSRDFQLFLGLLDAFYEGNFSRGEEIFGRFFHENPHNPRFGISLSFMAPFDPADALQADRYWRTLSNAWDSMEKSENPGDPWWKGHDRWSVILAVRMRLMAAYQWEALGRPDFALSIYRDLSTDPHSRPYRMKGPVYLGLARTAALMGDHETALKATEVLRESKKLKPWHKRAEKLQKEIEKNPPDYPIHMWSEASLPLIETYEGLSDSSANSARRGRFAFPRSQLRDYERRYGNSGDPALMKMLADAYYLAGLPNRALDLYGEVLSISGDNESIWALHFQSLINRSFILEAQGKIKDALEEMKRAADTLEEQDLVRYPVDARVDALERANGSS